MNRLLVIVAGVWLIAQVVKGNALERLGIIATASTTAPAPVPAGPNNAPAAITPFGAVAGVGGTDPAAAGNLSPGFAGAPRGGSLGGVR